MEEFARSEMLLGSDNIKKLANKKVLVFGIGGVGSYVCEALARCGVGTLGLVDNDTVSVSNINRQLIALHSTVGLYKTDVCQNRINDISPDCKVINYKMFYLPENAAAIDFSEYDYIVDAVDTVTAKLEIITRAKKLGIPVISSMGTGNKLDPEKLRITDIYKTSVCPLARVMRRELKTRGINSLDVVFSEEEPIKTENGERVPGSVSFVPSVAGLLIASCVIKNMIEKRA